MSSPVPAGRVLKCAITGPPVLRHISPVGEEKSIAMAGLSARMRATARTSACAAAGSFRITPHVSSPPAPAVEAPGDAYRRRNINDAAAANRRNRNAGDRFPGRPMVVLLVSGLDALDGHGHQGGISFDDFVDAIQGGVAERLLLEIGRASCRERV